MQMPQNLTTKISNLQAQRRIADTPFNDRFREIVLTEQILRSASVPSDIGHCSDQWLGAVSAKFVVCEKVRRRIATAGESTIGQLD